MNKTQHGQKESFLKLKTPAAGNQQLLLCVRMRMSNSQPIESRRNAFDLMGSEPFVVANVECVSEFGRIQTTGSDK